jgi:hypothetical protein
MIILSLFLYKINIIFLVYYIKWKDKKFTNHQSRKGSSEGFNGGLNVFDSGYDEKFEVSLADLSTGLYGAGIVFLSKSFQLI